MDNTITLNNACANCGQEINQNFCGNCGQKKFKRIDRKYIADELQYSLLHTNKGFFYSVKSIARNPGKTAREFVDGNRVNHYKPILLVLLLSGISAFVSFKIIELDTTMKMFYASLGFEGSFSEAVISALSTYNSFFMLMLVPVFACLTKLAFYKSGHNYFEHVVMNAFIVSYYTIINILLVYPILYFIKNDPQLTITAVMVTMACITPLMLIWFFKGFYPEKRVTILTLRVLLIGVVLVVLYFLLIILVTIGIAIVSPEIFQQMRQIKAQ